MGKVVTKGKPRLRKPSPKVSPFLLSCQNERFDLLLLGPEHVVGKRWSWTKRCRLVVDKWRISSSVLWNGWKQWESGQGQGIPTESWRWRKVIPMPISRLNWACLTQRLHEEHEITIWTSKPTRISSPEKFSHLRFWLIDYL